ncbi:MAG: ribosome biogenesis GTP-binding protein YihA/YsxC [Oscillospiraceae bacterium]|nr:ribosome biogenesis GTP-binding protein YihA/YsxC [Oscillospiraceae bacterium]
MNFQSAVFEMSAGLSAQLPESSLPEVVFSGRSNVGKSSLINALLGRKNLARTSGTPGKTATINFYRLNAVRFVDLPGYGYARVSESEKKRWQSLVQGYFDAERDMRLTVQLVDMRHPPSADDWLMLDYLAERETPFVVALTKSDKLNKSEYAGRLAALQADLHVYEGLRIIPFSAVTREGVEILREIIQTSVEEEEDL